MFSSAPGGVNCVQCLPGTFQPEEGMNKFLLDFFDFEDLKFKSQGGHSHWKGVWVGSPQYAPFRPYTLPTHQLLNLEFQFESVFNFDFLCGPVGCLITHTCLCLCHTLHRSNNFSIQLHSHSFLALSHDWALVPFPGSSLGIPCPLLSLQGSSLGLQWHRKWNATGTHPNFAIYHQGQKICGWAPPSGLHLQLGHHVYSTLFMLLYSELEYKHETGSKPGTFCDPFSSTAYIFAMYFNLPF